MPGVPENPKIFHITHVDNLRSMFAEGYIISDARRIEQGLENTNVGMSAIKARRLALEVDCHPGTRVGDFVPFYFCPRSIMLYLIYRGNHPELSYTGGQSPIVHLEMDLKSVVQWCQANNHRWAFTKSNAGAYYTSFFNDLDQLGQIMWEAVEASDFRDPQIKEGKQAEFLLFEECPCQLIDRIGVIDEQTAEYVDGIVGQFGHQSVVSVQRGWYY